MWLLQEIRKNSLLVCVSGGLSEKQSDSRDSDPDWCGFSRSGFFANWSRPFTTFCILSSSKVKSFEQSYFDSSKFLILPIIAGESSSKRNSRAAARTLSKVVTIPCKFAAPTYLALGCRSAIFRLVCYRTVQIFILTEHRNRWQIWEELKVLWKFWNWRKMSLPCSKVAPKLPEISSEVWDRKQLSNCTGSRQVGPPPTRPLLT